VFTKSFFYCVILYFCTNWHKLSFKGLIIWTVNIFIIIILVMTCKWTLWWLMCQDYENLDLLECINRSFALHKTLDSIACKLVFLSLVSHFIMLKFFAVVLHDKSTRWFFFISKLRIHYWKRPQICPFLSNHEISCQQF